MNSPQKPLLGDIGFIGLDFMGKNLVLNMNDHGYTVVVYHRTTEKADPFLAEEAKETKLLSSHSIKELVAQLKVPRRVMILVKSGQPVDDCIEQLLPHLEKGDIIIDGSHSLFGDTKRRQHYIESKGMLFVGMGVLGGEEGMRHGPSMMPGGSPGAWIHVKEIFQAIAAKVDNGTPCCDWVGEEGAGHYVKMVHNGMEYGDRQLIGEVFQLLQSGLGLSEQEISTIVSTWNEGALNSYLMKMKRDGLGVEEERAPLVAKTLDRAEHKETGKWMVSNSLDLGIPTTVIAEAVFARCVSSMKEERVVALKKLKGPKALIRKAKNINKRQLLIKEIHDAFNASNIISYAQGYMLLCAASREYGWNLNLGGITLIWRGSYIMRSRFLEKIKEAFDKNPKLTNLLFDDYFRIEMERSQKGWRHVISLAAKHGIPVSAFSTALSFYDSYRTANLPANLLQAQ